MTQQVVLAFKSTVPRALTRCQTNSTLRVLHFLGGIYSDVHWAQMQPDFRPAQTQAGQKKQQRERPETSGEQEWEKKLSKLPFYSVL